MTQGILKKKIMTIKPALQKVLKDIPDRDSEVNNIKETERMNKSSRMSSYTNGKSKGISNRKIKQ